MQKNLINKENIYLFHWHTIMKEKEILFDAFYAIENSDFEICHLQMKSNNLDLHNLDNFYTKIAVCSITFSDVLDKIMNYHNDEEVNFSFTTLTIDELLNHQDKVMIGTKKFKEKIYPYIRDQKIKKIINGD